MYVELKDGFGKITISVQHWTPGWSYEAKFKLLFRWIIDRVPDSEPKKGAKQFYFQNLTLSLFKIRVVPFTEHSVLEETKEFLDVHVWVYDYKYSLKNIYMVRGWGIRPN